MYDYLFGNLTRKQPTEAVLEVNGVGYLLKISLSTSQLLPEEGHPIKLFTHLHVREDLLQLYGFSTEEEREMFRGLISVSGIGPKLAQTVLSGLSPEKFASAVCLEDEKTISSISGIGKKTAQRLIVELKDKLSAVASITDTGAKKAPEFKDDTLKSETIMALISLGYSKNQAEKAFEKIPDIGSLKTVEDMIRQALKSI